MDLCKSRTWRSNVLGIILLINANRLMSGQMVLRIYRVKLKLYPTEKENSTSEQIGSFLTKRLVCHAWPQSSATEVKRAGTATATPAFHSKKAGEPALRRLLTSE